MKVPSASRFLDYQGNTITDIKEYVQNWLHKVPYGKIYVGCDSKVRGKWVKYSTVICMWKVGEGVSEIYRNEVDKTPPDSFSRLWGEVTRAVETADRLKELAAITVHVDINSNPKYRSYQLYDASIGYIRSMGFIAEGKPHSWAASCGAHNHCK